MYLRLFSNELKKILLQYFFNFRYVRSSFGSPAAALASFLSSQQHRHAPNHVYAELRNDPVGSTVQVQLSLAPSPTPCWVRCCWLLTAVFVSSRCCWFPDPIAGAF
eukprot:GHVU01037410.1.p1 GENE.GHVU01037410.1~~GHVU01037410.1.p1  ORF type:complete len:106 (-),score=3.79 GHVU01037410.1:337-654(-)